MRRDHQPFWYKKLCQQANQWYSRNFVLPHFDRVGLCPRFLAPRSIQVHGSGICIGDYFHGISNPLKPIKFTTWQDKNQQGELHIGSCCLVSPGVEITAARSVHIGNNCMLAADVMIHDSDWHGLYNRVRPFRCTEGVTLHNNVWVGARAIILKGVSIGDNAVVGAGAVVTKSVPANTVVAGNPAKVVKTLNPKRRMLTREFLFARGDQYWHQQQEIEAFFTLDNTTAHWLRTCLAPSNFD